MKILKKLQKQDKIDELIREGKRLSQEKDKSSIKTRDSSDPEQFDPDVEKFNEKDTSILLTAGTYYDNSLIQCMYFYKTSC